MYNGRQRRWLLELCKFLGKWKENPPKAQAGGFIQMPE